MGVVSAARITGGKQREKSKRKRANTGSVSYESYESMDLDEKLNVLFSKI